MDGQNLALSVAVVILGFACFVIGTVAVTIPYWGTFRNRIIQETGNFGPWTLCKDLQFGNQVCGKNISMFKPMYVVQAAGICAAVGIGALGLYCLISLLQISMQVTKSHLLFKYKNALIAKLVFAVLAALMTITAVGLFSRQKDDHEHGYLIEVHFSFYMEVVLCIFTFILMLMTAAEWYIARKIDDHFPASSSSRSNGAGRLSQMGFGTTIGNPGFQDHPSSLHTNNGITMTESSVRFVQPPPPLPLHIQLKQLKQLRLKNAASNLSVQSGSGGGGGSGVSRLDRAKVAAAAAAAVKKQKQSGGKSKKPPKPKSPKKLKSLNKKKSKYKHWVDDSVSSLPTSADNASSVSYFSTGGSTVSTLVSGAGSALSSGSTNTSRNTPLRSSLKKPRSQASTPDNDFGIRNPGFTGTSPTLSRTGSVKKVRIQTHSTDV